MNGRKERCSRMHWAESMVRAGVCTSVWGRRALRHPRKVSRSSAQARRKANALERALRMLFEKRPVWKCRSLRAPIPRCVPENVHMCSMHGSPSRLQASTSSSKQCSTLPTPSERSTGYSKQQQSTSQASGQARGEAAKATAGREGQQPPTLSL